MEELVSDSCAGGKGLSVSRELVEWTASVRKKQQMRRRGSFIGKLAFAEESGN